MDILQNNKNKKIHEMLSTVKLASLLLSGTAFFRYFTPSGEIFYNDNLFFIFLTGVAALILALVYVIWAFSTKNKEHSARYIGRMQLIENVIFTFVFFSVIFLTGAHKSEYKFLFLFIITTNTIQSGMKQGLAVAFTSSVLILAMDIFGVADIPNDYFQDDLILAGLFILTAWPLGYYVRLEKEHIAKLEGLANKDGLTGVYNHRYFHDTLRNKILLNEKRNTSLSMIFIDIDYFKHYNDLYGHQKGDEILRQIASLLKGNVRYDDIVARYGGEEFAIILPDTLEAEAFAIAERIRKQIEETHFEGQENQPNGAVTVSIGISTYPDKAKSDVELIKSADDALYRAKFFNKNRVETYTSILDELKKDIEAEHIDLITSIKTLISVINAKDKYTYGHVERVVMYCRLLADKLCLSEADKKNLIYGAYMHDIGKINIAKEVLIKKMPLNNDEWEMLKQHSVNGVEIIKPVDSLKEVSPLIMHHHERYDGKGYPHNLKGEEIPFLARVLTVVDSFDAMTSNRPYNKRRTYAEAVEELRKCSGTQFDPFIAEAFIEVMQDSEFKFEDITSVYDNCAVTSGE
jgi:diguanylate cyclase (GGDEF)-like protein